MSSNEIKRQLEEGLSGHPVAPLCLRIVSRLEELPKAHLQMLTYSSLLNISGKFKFDQELLAAIALLSNSPLDALEMRALFIDNDDQSFEVAIEEVEEAQETGKFIHPETGYPVPDFEKKIVPYFIPSARFFAKNA